MLPVPDTHMHACMNTPSVVHSHRLTTTMRHVCARRNAVSLLLASSLGSCCLDKTAHCKPTCLLSACSCYLGHVRSRSHVQRPHVVSSLTVLAVNTRSPIPAHKHRPSLLRVHFSTVLREQQGNDSYDSSSSSDHSSSSISVKQNSDISPNFLDPTEADLSMSDTATTAPKETDSNSTDSALDTFKPTSSQDDASQPQDQDSPQESDPSTVQDPDSFTLPGNDSTTLQNDDASTLDSTPSTSQQPTGVVIDGLQANITSPASTVETNSSQADSGSTADPNDTEDPYGIDTDAAVDDGSPESQEAQHQQRLKPSQDEAGDSTAEEDVDQTDSSSDAGTAIDDDSLAPSNGTIDALSDSADYNNDAESGSGPYEDSSIADGGEQQGIAGKDFAGNGETDKLTAAEEEEIELETEYDDEAELEQADDAGDRRRSRRHLRARA